jgi:hypothetical protein
VGGALFFGYWAVREVDSVIATAGCYSTEFDASTACGQMGNLWIATIDAAVAVTFLIVLWRTLQAAAPPGRPRPRSGATPPHTTMLGGQSRPGNRPPFFP